jgi:hypothetical protein
MAKRKKKGGSWKGFLAGMGIAGLVGLIGLATVAAPSAARVRQALMNKLSILADRADELAQAWENRKIAPKQAPVLDAPSRPAASAKPTRTERPAAPPAASSPAPAPAPSTAPRQESAPPPPAAPEKDITPDDQKQLRELLRQLNQGGN